MTTKEKRKQKHVIITDIKSTRVIPMSMIIRVQACGPYSMIYNKNGEEIVWCKHLKEVQQLLDRELFFRIHKGHVVNMNEVIQYISGRGGKVLLSDGVVLEVALRRKVEFLVRFQLTA